MPHGGLTVAAILVTYRPELSLLAEVLDSLRGQADRTIIVDNASPPETRSWLAARAAADGLTVISLDRNVGLAAGQNEGIAAARAAQVDAVLLLDQDSRLDPGMVDALASALKDLESAGERPAAVGPVFVEEHRGRVLPFPRADGLWPRLVAVEGIRPVQVDFLIASGKLIPVSALDAVGLMEGPLFIDLIDFEWCMRAAAKGYRVFAVPTARMRHRIGIGGLKLGRRTVPVHAPLRNRTYVRNALAMLGRVYVPRAWKLYFLSRVLAFATVYPLLLDRRRERAWMIARGVREGIGRSLSGPPSPADPPKG